MTIRSSALLFIGLTSLAAASEPTFDTSLPPGVRRAEFRELAATPAQLDDSAPARKADEPFAVARPDGRFLALAGGLTEFAANQRLDSRLLDQAGRVGLDGRPRQVVYGFVGFERRQTMERLAQIEALGVRLLGAFPPYAQLAALPIERLPEIATVPGVAFVGAAQPEHKVHPELLRRLHASVGTFEAYICVFDDDRTEQMVTERLGSYAAVRGSEVAEVGVPAEMGQVIRSTGGWQERRLHGHGVATSLYIPAARAFRAKLDIAQLLQVIDHDFVLSVQPVSDPVAAHEESVPLISADVTRAFHSGLPTKYAIAGEIDTGLFAGHESLSNHAFFGWDYFPGSTSPFSDICHPGDTGHGTHVAGTILGDPPLANQRFRGVSPQLCKDWPRTFRFVKAIGDSSCPAPAIPFSTLASNMRGTIVVSGSNSPAPMLVNNSWGSGPAQNGWLGTEVEAIEIDTEVFTTGTTYVFAAANHGPTTKSVCSQGSAKNAITVGNVTDFNAPGANGIEIPSKLYTGPSGSSRGPCGDGRFKPNVTAPGIWITSALSTGANHYGAYVGTSMATPHVTGVIAQICDLYPAARYRPHVAASMLMATANTPDDQPFDDPPAAWVNDYGAGRIDAYRAQFSDTQFQLEPTYFTLNGSQSTTGNFTIGSGAKRLVIVFHYLETAAAPGAAKALVNDLDLYLDLAPFSATINAGEWSSISGINNTEMITVENPVAGSYQYKIHPYSVGPTAAIQGSVTAHVLYGDPTPTPGIQLTASDTIVKPNAPVTVHGAVINSVTSADALFFEAVDHTGATKILTTTTLADGVVTNLTNNQNANPADSGFDVMLGNVLHDNGRSVDWTFQYATQGVKDFVLKAYRGGQMVMSDTPITITVDGTPPSNPSNVSSTTHTVNVWSNNPNLTFTWSASTDNVGLAGYSVGTAPNLSLADDILDIPPVTTWSTVSGTTNSLYFLVKAIDQAGNGSLTAPDGPYRIDLVPPTAATGTVSTSHTVGVWSTSKSVAVQWNAASDAHSGVAGYSVNYSTVPGFTPATILSVPANQTSTITGVSDSATNYIAIRTVDVAGNGAATWETIGPFKCDTLQPSAITGLTSPTHTVNAPFSTNSSVTVNWNAATDLVSGMAGYVTAWSTSPNSEPTGGITTVGTTETTILSASNLGWYFHVRARDVAGNLGPTAHLGPFLVDDAGPFVGNFVINSNVIATTSPLVSLTITASNAASGLDAMRFKNDGGVFSAWQPFSGSAIWQLTTSGGSTTKGTRTVIAEIRDVAGNVSTVSDTIYYHDAPVTYGTACSGSLGVPTFSVTGPTGLGQTMTMAVTNTAATTGILYLGLSKTNYLGLPLPLAIPGSGGCAINTSLDFQLWAGPVVPLPLAVPSNPLFAGLAFHAQWFLTNDPIGHVVATRGVSVTLAGL